MSRLNDLQFKQVESRLLSMGTKSSLLQEELLDHICCEIEEQMNSGQAFEAAMEIAFSQFTKTEVQALERHTHQLLFQKSNPIMKILALSSLALLLYFPASLGLQLEPPSIRPIAQQYDISSGFGMRLHPILKTKKLHKGVDFAAPAGTPVKATGIGTVKEVKLQEGGYGKHIIIDHGDGYESWYAQLSEIDVAEGQQIQKGEIIGKVGSTGASTRPHLHYEVRKDGKSLDPAQFF
jgi:murein DD-endopeptidase MepM/ murein hydrolase activator NlpD